VAEFCGSREVADLFVTQKTLALFLICAVSSWSMVRAGEETRQIQEELRKRHLFFREIDGKPSAELSLALKQYQQRQGFAQTGTADEMTLYSLGIGEPPSPAEGAGDLPDMPVLKSDAAVHDDTRPKVPPVPTKEQNAGDVAKAAIHSFLRRYFDACQSPNPEDELAFFADKVDYFDHGVVDRPYIKNELAVYDQRWPNRKYNLGDSLRVIRSGNNTIAKIRVNFQVANNEHSRSASGRTDDTFNLAKRGDSLEIVAIKEKRVRKVWRHRRRPPSFPDAVGRTIHHVFRSIFH
jgi:peptidoglycan hydrolase-like protein with peptidoglycan-binding domain